MEVPISKSEGMLQLVPPVQVLLLQSHIAFTYSLIYELFTLQNHYEKSIRKVNKPLAFHLK